ncbi:VWA domain-containing protein [Sinomonas sp. ASV486]|uniref:VWA domain-containing protein n=1 Tax=Sinomonas sp. ASV486 TaxID=3051170 RepID=UPI0027DD2F56|nr:VWA domain-containing protein [Sinomonas sp. ASV486]MDQ4490786.1 VWA domain-containing protein [Sinomonas sp. ASV486]
MGISLEKVEQKAPELLTLAKTAADAIDTARLNGQRAKVALVLDYSGSMRSKYESGAMQRLTQTILALGVHLDDDGEIDLFTFDSAARHEGTVTLENFRDAIAKITVKRRMGTTDYAAAFRTVLDHFRLAPKAGGGLFRKSAGFSAVDARDGQPVLAVFLTDGSPDSKAAAVREITRASYAPVFWQFLSIGRESIAFLQELDDLEGRYVDNADYKPVGDVDATSPQDLYAMLLDEYPGWLADQRTRGHIH